MEKRKLKFNILDVAIIVVLICAVVALVFRGTVKEMFEEPQVIKLRLVLATDKNNPATEEMFELYNTVYVDGNTQLQSAVIDKTEDDEKLVLTLECEGYKKLGKFYTEHGDLLSGVDECTVQYGDMRVRCEIRSIEQKD